MLIAPSRPRRLALVALVAVAAALAGCGASAPERDAPAGTAIELGGVSYVVEASRQLNPLSAGDGAYFTGVPKAGRSRPGLVWLGVFLQATNNSRSPRRTARSLVVADAFNHVYHPAALSRTNPFAYRPATLAAGDTLPAPTSPAATSTEPGRLLLVQLPTEQFMDNRPLELRIDKPDAHTKLASVQLDL